MVGRVLADTGLLVWTLAITTAVGFASCFRLSTDIGHGLAAFGLRIVFSFALEWLLGDDGARAGIPQAAQGIDACVTADLRVERVLPSSTMPSWMQGFAEHPAHHRDGRAVRCLTGGADIEALLSHSTNPYVGLSLLWAAAIIAAVAPIAVARVARR